MSPPPDVDDVERQGAATTTNRIRKSKRDPLREPRRTIPKQRHEYELRDKSTGWTAKTRPRGVAFAAPYPRSGVVLSTPSTWKDWLLPGPLSLKDGLQFWYVFVAQSVVAAIISGAANFGVACATYNHYDRNVTPIYLWRWFPVPLAGDMGVTVIIQQIVTMIVTSALVHRDLVGGPIAPLRRPWPPLLHLPSTPSPTGSWLGTKIKGQAPEKGLYMGKAEGSGVIGRYFWWGIRSFLTGSERNDWATSGISMRQRFERLLWTAVQGFVVCLLTFWWYWPIAIAIVAPIYGGRNLAGTYIPAIIKLLYGGIMGLLTNPLMALLGMGAESSVRRAYPELEMWRESGGDEDYAAWLEEQGIGNEKASAERGEATSAPTTTTTTTTTAPSAPSTASNPAASTPAGAAPPS